MSSPMERTPKAPAARAEATLTNWDGHFAVDNSTFSSRLCRTAGALIQCGAQPPATGSKKERSRKHRSCCQSTAHGDSSTSSSCENGEEDNDAGHSVQRWCRSARRNRRYTDTSVKRATGSSNSPTEHNQRNCRQQARSWGGGTTTSVGGISRNSPARLGGAQFLSIPTTMGSSLIGDSMTEIIIEDLQHENEPTSAILDYCKRKFLRPYVVILSLVGLSPMSTDTTICRACVGYSQALFMIVLLIFGYVLQYLCGYRGDRGFANYRKILPTATSVPTSGDQLSTSHPTATHTIGELLFGYVIPNVLHLCGFVSAVIVCKFIGKEQLQQLVERVFLVSMKPRRLCRVLWLYVASGLVLLGSLVAYVMPSVLMQSQMVQAKWLTEILSDYQVPLKLTLLFSLFVQDLVEIVILSSYCIECYLLRIHLATLSHKLLMHSIESLDWMREVLEFRKLLDHLNQRVAIPVCFFIVMNLSYAFAGFVYLFNDFDFHYSALKVVVLNIINVFLWLFMGLVPFFMAASVTRICQTAQANGHQIRVRPFVYHNTSSDDLNSTLLFASSLDMSAKLFRMPIQPNYVCFAILVVAIVVLTLGMCLNLSLLGDF